MRAIINSITEWVALSLAALATWGLLLGCGCVRVESEEGRRVVLHSLPCVFSGGCDLK